MKRLFFILTFITSQVSAQTDSTRLYFEVPKTFAETLKGMQSNIVTVDHFDFTITKNGEYVVPIGSLMNFEDVIINRWREVPSWTIRVMKLNPSDFPAAQDSLPHE